MCENHYKGLTVVDDINLTCLHSLDDYYAHVIGNTETNKRKILVHDEMVFKASKWLGKKVRTSEVVGVSYPAGCTTKFSLCVDSPPDKINWRESLTCPVTQTNNRQRAALHFFDLKCKPSESDQIYVSEQLTPFYKTIKQRYANTTGSEYLGDSYSSGDVNKDGIRHEDFTELSFANQSLDHIISLDCFEHIPNYMQAFSEAVRVLRSGGTMLATFPFALNHQENLIRAEVTDNGDIIHHLPPEYHGDPVSKEGVLCYQVFGWEVLDQLTSSGFSEASLYLMWSRKFGYLGPDQIMIFCRK